jgi:hypothetical protein
LRRLNSGRREIGCREVRTHFVIGIPGFRIYIFERGPPNLVQWFALMRILRRDQEGKKRTDENFEVTCRSGRGFWIEYPAQLADTGML